MGLTGNLTRNSAPPSGWLAASTSPRLLADDALHDGQTKAGAVLALGEEGFEEAAGIGFLETGARVANAALDAIAEVEDLDPYGALAGRVLHGVLQQVLEHLENAGGVDRNLGQVVVGADRELDVFGLRRRRADGCALRR